MNKEVSPELMQFRRSFPHILQEIWEVDTDKGLVRVSNLDVTYVYHRGTLRPSQLGTFDYAILSATKDDCIVICIDLLLPMGWVDSAKFSARSQKH